MALGITTLLTYVPVPLGAAHQGGAMVLFTLMLGLLYTIKPTPSLGTFRWGVWVRRCVLGAGDVDVERGRRCCGFCCQEGGWEPRCVAVREARQSG